MTLDPKTFLTSIFDAAVAAADPELTIRQHLPAKPKGRTVVIGAGKGSAQMAAAFEKVWDGPVEGLIVTRYGYGAPTKHLEVVEAAHPVPDAAGLAAAKRLQQAVSGLSEDDLVIALICGGGSALLPAPAGDLTLTDEIAVNEALLASGARVDGRSHPGGLTPLHLAVRSGHDALARLLRRHLLERLLEDLGQLGDGLRERVEPRLQVRDLVLLLGLEGRENPALVLDRVEPLL